MAFISDEQEWAEALFGRATVGDLRRTRRLVRYAAAQARHPNASTVVAGSGDKAAVEGAYRLLRNDEVDATAMNESAFVYTASQLASYALVLALEDTTSLSFSHRSVRDELGDIGGKKTHQARGFWVHSTLLVDAHGADVLGLIEQHYWRRGSRGKKGDRKKRRYGEKESFKWQRASEAMTRRLGEHMARVISVCDREADVFEYLSYKRAHGQRFVIRAAWDRAMQSDSARDHLWSYITSQAILGERTVMVNQRGGRVKREARLSLRVGYAELRPPRRPSGDGEQPEPLGVHVILAQETEAPDGLAPLSWLLLSSEPVASWIQANQVLDYYTRRSEIEGFHKVWKSGCAVEKRRFQEAATIERVAIILAHIAVRLMQLHALQRTPDTPCSHLLTRLEWICLWHSIERSPPPKNIPTIAWAINAVARMGGWNDSKQTGRIGWSTIWRGWGRLQERVEGWKLANQYQANE